MALTKIQRSARAAFVNLYGSETRDVVSHIARGWNSTRIADKLQLPVESVAAFRANVTRGTYVPFVEGNLTEGFEGTCSF